MANIFVSYNRQTEAITKALVEDVQALGHTVWFDQELSGGQAWWDQILSMIRRCDLFIFVLDPAALNSVACQREYGYAADLRKSILPVLVSEGVSINLLPLALSQIEFVDYRKQDRTAGFRLARAVNAVPPTAALPDPLPDQPKVPISYLGSLAAKIQAAAPLTHEEQITLVSDLRRGLRDPKTADDTRTLLKMLRERRDVFAGIRDEIDELSEGLTEADTTVGEQSNQETYKIARLKNYLEERKTRENPWRRIRRIANRNAIPEAEVLELLRRDPDVEFKIEEGVRWAKIKS